MWLVGGLDAIFYVPIYWVSNHPNWLSYFSEGFKPPTRWECKVTPHDSLLSLGWWKTMVSPHEFFWDAFHESISRVHPGQTFWCLWTRYRSRSRSPLIESRTNQLCVTGKSQFLWYEYLLKLRKMVIPSPSTSIISTIRGSPIAPFGKRAKHEEIHCQSQVSRVR